MSSTGSPVSNDDDLLALDRQVCFGLAVASRSVIAFYRPILEPLGLTHPQYLVMLALWQGAPLKFKDLAAQLRLDPATLTPIVRRLERDELIERGRLEGDDRSFTLSPTEKGAALRQQALAVPSTVIERLGLPVEQLLALRDGLTDLIAAVDRAT
ncbi:MAG: MarR family transcriptional regulator [Actinomycetota bacterium]|nr:MarR family transcriptional regulator [Actinomycetota bacterium]